MDALSAATAVIACSPERLTLHPGERREAVLRVLRAAQSELRVSLFRCDDLFIVDELAQAARRGVRLRVLMTPKAKGWKKRLQHLEEFLTSLGAEVRRYPSAELKYHAKYVVADDGPALIGSLNFTRKCFQSTCDFLLTTWEPGIIAGLKALFEADCTAPPPALPEGLDERLIVGPNGARARMRELLQQAQRSIRIIDHRVTDPEMVALLEARKAEGVAVEVLGRDALGGLNPHGKMVLVDGEVAVLGSLALCTPSLDGRREVAVVVRHPECVAELNRFLESLAQRGPEEEG